MQAKKYNNSSKKYGKQTELPLFPDEVPMGTESGKSAKASEKTESEPEVKSNKKPKTKSSEKAPNEMMQVVAQAVPVKKKLQRSFDKEEVERYLENKRLQEEERELRKGFKNNLKRVKRLVLDMEATNRDRLILYQSSENGQFYKALDTSALYYAYRLADRMGRKCSVMVDTDRFSKAQYVASISGILKFVEQYVELGGKEPEVTVDGVYIFPLKEPISDEELRMLRQTEKTRMETMHGQLMPKKMAPAIYQQILMIIRQLTPRSEKLRKESINYRTFGDEMLKNLRDILSVYAEYTNGFIDGAKAAERILIEIGEIKATLIILGETRKWGAAPLTVAGDNLNTLEQMVRKEFGLA